MLFFVFLIYATESIAGAEWEIGIEELQKRTEYQKAILNIHKEIQEELVFQRQINTTIVELVKNKNVMIITAITVNEKSINQLTKDDPRLPELAKERDRLEEVKTRSDSAQKTVTTSLETIEYNLGRFVKAVEFYEILLKQSISALIGLCDTLIRRNVI